MNNRKHSYYSTETWFHSCRLHGILWSTGSHSTSLLQLEPAVAQRPIRTVRNSQLRTGSGVWWGDPKSGIPNLEQGAGTEVPHGRLRPSFPPPRLAPSPPRHFCHLTRHFCRCLRCNLSTGFAQGTRMTKITEITKVTRQFLLEISSVWRSCGCSCPSATHRHALYMVHGSCCGFGNV